MNSPNSISELVNEWPSIAAFAADIGCGYEAARKMRDRGSIGANHWVRVVEVCNQKNIPGVSFEWLAKMRVNA